MNLQKIFIQVTSTVATTVVFSGAIALEAPKSAQAATFEWEFSNVIGGIDGTVSGTLEVPEGEDVSATSLILTSTTNSEFDSLVGVDFTALPNFDNRFNVVDGTITAALFSNDWLTSTNNIALELNSEVFGDLESQNLGLLTTAGNPLDDICPGDCLQTAPLFGDNTGETQFAPTFTAVPEASSVAGLFVTFGLIGINQLRKKIR